MTFQEINQANKTQRLERYYEFSDLATVQLMARIKEEVKRYDTHGTTPKGFSSAIALYLASFDALLIDLKKPLP